MAGVCGRCCQLEDSEIEVKQPVKKSGAPGFQGPLDAAFSPQDVRDPKPTAVEELSSQKEESRQDEMAPPPPMAAPESGSPTGDDGRPTTSTTPTNFKTTIVKGERKLGIDINYHDNVTLLVTKINEGPVMDHNSSNQSERILPGDRIIELNGIRGNTQQMLASCKGATELQVTVTTGVERTTQLVPTGGETSLGLTVEQCDMVSLVITKVEDGLAMMKGRREGPELEMKAEDRIVGINGAKLDAAALLQELNTASSWDISWRRVEMKAL